jgi:hypothetical protein
MVSHEPEQIDMTESVRLLRVALARAFPEVQFDLTVDDQDVRVTWVDGPTQTEVHNLAVGYAGWDYGDYSLEETEFYLSPDGASRWAASPQLFSVDQAPPEGSRRVRFAPYHVWVDRKLSPAFRAEIVALIEQETGEPFDPDARSTRDVPFKDTILKGIGPQIVWQASCYINKTEGTDKGQSAS